VWEAELILRLLDSPWWNWRRIFNPLKFRRFSRSVDKFDAIVVDLETGGLDPSKHAIVRFGVVAISRGSVVDSFEVGVIPFEGSIIDYGAVKVNGWTGVSLDDVPEARALALLEQTFALFNDRVPSMGHNVDFDLSFLAAAARRSSTAWPPKRMHYRRFDSCQSASMFVVAGRHSGRSLDDLCRAYGLWDELDRAGKGHKSPLNDCMASVSVMLEMAWEVA
jgi:DNA polymerase III epsilon subunit-like protein